MSKRRPQKARSVDHAKIMNSCDDKALRVGLPKLSETEQVVHLISIFNFEIELGGAETFYTNTSGALAVPMVAALREIGATSTAAALRSLNKEFSSKGPPKTSKLRRAKCTKIRESNGDAFREIDRVFAAEEPDVFDKLCAYIESHLKDLHKHHV